jgi:hypothetical protein
MSLAGTSAVLASFVLMSAAIANSAALILWRARTLLVIEDPSFGLFVLLVVFASVLSAKMETAISKNYPGLADMFTLVSLMFLCGACVYLICGLIYIAFGSMQIMSGLVCLFLFKWAADNYKEST